MSDDNVIQFPSRHTTDLAEWFSTIASRVQDTPLDSAILILENDKGEQIVYVKDDMRKDMFAGQLQIAMLKGLYESVAE